MHMAEQGKLMSLVLEFPIQITACFVLSSLSMCFVPWMESGDSME